MSDTNFNPESFAEALSGCTCCDAFLNQPPALVVMAAGMGSRFGGLKQMAAMGKSGEPILAFSAFDAYAAGFRHFVFVIKEEMAADFRGLIVEPLLRRFPDAEAQVVFQKLTDLPQGTEVPDGRVKPWGTAHAVLAARDAVQGPFAVINSDDYYGKAGFSLIFEHLSHVQNTGDYCMVAYDLQNTLSENGSVSRGVCEVQDGKLARIVEQSEVRREGDHAVSKENSFGQLSLQAPVSMNLWGFTPDFLTQLRGRFPEFLVKALMLNPLKAEYPLPGVVDALLREGLATVTVLHSPDRWYGVTYKEDTVLVQNALQQMQASGAYPKQIL